jgi:hypothetical protein
METRTEKKIFIFTFSYIFSALSVVFRGIIIFLLEGPRELSLLYLQYLILCLSFRAS